ncbi:unnamed protein product [Dracunculus medinensis]|uniref:39S ribosomal protein L46, mitochondrial n=1 Tax=Dracunculus medinensis TaxID=318479 RepID=A0A0N4U3Q7_DRAME|nr:unnamed protein product [Dracunculus medinensis]
MHLMNCKYVYGIYTVFPCAEPMRQTDAPNANAQEISESQIRRNIFVGKNNQKWSIFVAVAIIRPPIIAPQMSDSEKNYSFFTKNLEIETSLLCDFELKEIDDKKFLEKKKEQSELEKLADKLGEQRITTDMLQERWKKREEYLRKTFRLGDLSEIEQNAETSLFRKLDQQLVLIVRQRFGKPGYSSPWIIPQTKFHNGESLRQTAERCINETLEGDFAGSIFSNAPFSVHSHRYPKGLKNNDDSDTSGAKIFFYNAQIAPQNNFHVNSNEIVEYKWVNMDEFQKYVITNRYKNALSTLFINW